MASSELELLLRLGVRGNDEAVADVRKFRQEVEKELKATSKAAEAEARAQARAAQILGDSRQRAAENVISAFGGQRALFIKDVVADLRVLRKESAEAGGVLNALSNQFGAGAVAVGVLALGVGALVTVSAAAVGGLIVLLKHAAEAGARFHDLSIETGLSVETLSGLELQLKQSGAAVEDLGLSAFEMQKRLDDAAQGNKRLKATFADLGVKDAKAALQDTDGTLRKVLSSLAAIQDAGQRNAVGNEVLGKSYKQLRVFIAEAGGNLDEVIKKAQAAGLVMSKEAAAAADEFGDAMDELALKADRFTTQIGSALIPELLKLFRVLTVESQNAGSIVSYVANSIGQSFRNATNEILVLIAALKTLPAAAQLARAAASAGALTNPAVLAASGEVLKAQFGANLRETVTTAYAKPPDAVRAPTDFTRSGSGGEKKAKGMSAEEAAKRIREIEFERLKAVSDRTLEIERYLFEQRSRSLQDYTRRQIEEAQKVFIARLDLLSKEEEAAKKLKGREREVRLAELAKEQTEATLEFASKKSRAQEEADNQEFESRKAHRQSLLSQAEEADRRDLSRIEYHVSEGNKTYARAERERADILKESFKRRREELELQLREAGANLEERQQIVDQLDELYEEESTAAQEAHQKIRAAVKQTLEVQREYYRSIERLHDETQELLREATRIELERSELEITNRREYLRRQLELEREANAARHEENLRRIDEEQQAHEELLRQTGEYEARRLELERLYEDLRKAERERRREEKKQEKEKEQDLSPLEEIKDSFGKPQDFGDFGMDAIVGGIKATTGALKEGIAAWLLYGESIGQAMKKALAAHLAKVAAEAGIQALLHAAYAIASFAFGDVRGAVEHAKAAALFAAVAVAAGVAARGLAKSAGLYGQNGQLGGGGSSTQPEFETDRQRREREEREANSRTRSEERGQAATLEIPVKIDGTEMGRALANIYSDGRGGFRARVVEDVNKSRGI